MLLPGRARAPPPPPPPPARLPCCCGGGASPAPAPAPAPHPALFLHPCRLPLDDPRRFRVEILFSPGASHDPFEVVPIKGKDHVLPILPRMPVHDVGDGGERRGLGCSWVASS